MLKELNNILNTLVCYPNTNATKRACYLPIIIRYFVISKAKEVSEIKQKSTQQ